MLLQTFMQKNCAKMLTRVLKVLILIAFLARLSICHLRDVTASRTSDKNDNNDSMEFPNLLLQQKESEGVSSGIAAFLRNFLEE